jgi:hypothetical protein
MPGCLRCRTYGSLSVIGPITVTVNGTTRFDTKDPVSLTIAPHQEHLRPRPRDLGVVFPKMS